MGSVTQLQTRKQDERPHQWFSCLLFTKDSNPREAQVIDEDPFPSLLTPEAWLSFMGHCFYSHRALPACPPQDLLSLGHSAFVNALFWGGHMDFMAGTRVQIDIFSFLKKMITNSIRLWQ